MLTISLKAHWQVAAIMLNKCRQHSKQDQEGLAGKGINSKVEFYQLSCRGGGRDHPVCMWTAKFLFLFLLKVFTDGARHN